MCRMRNMEMKCAADVGWSVVYMSCPYNAKSRTKCRRVFDKRIKKCASVCAWQCAAAAAMLLRALLSDHLGYTE